MCGGSPVQNCNRKILWGGILATVESLASDLTVACQDVKIAARTAGYLAVLAAILTLPCPDVKIAACTAGYLAAH